MIVLFSCKLHANAQHLHGELKKTYHTFISYINIYIVRSEQKGLIRPINAQFYFI